MKTQSSSRYSRGQKYLYTVVYIYEYIVIYPRTYIIIRTADNIALKRLMSILKPTGLILEVGRDFDLKQSKALIPQSEYVGVIAAVSNSTAVF